MEDRLSLITITQLLLVVMMFSLHKERVPVLLVLCHLMWPVLRTLSEPGVRIEKECINQNETRVA